jgi:hypothetical protein
LIVDPDPALAPVIDPVIVPIVQTNVLGAEADNEILGPVPLHIVAVFAEVTEGFGFTVTVMVYAAPVQLPALEVGVIMYCTVPELASLGLVSV